MTPVPYDRPSAVAARRLASKAEADRDSWRRVAERLEGERDAYQSALSTATDALVVARAQLTAVPGIVERMLVEHLPTNDPGCTCGWEAFRGVSFVAHRRDVLTAAVGSLPNTEEGQ